MDPIFSSYEGTQPKGYVVPVRGGFEWRILTDEGLMDCGFEFTEEKARRECRKSFNEEVEACQ